MNTVESQSGTGKAIVQDRTISTGTFGLFLRPGDAEKHNGREAATRASTTGDCFGFRKDGILIGPENRNAVPSAYDSAFQFNDCDSSVSWSTSLLMARRQARGSSLGDNSACPRSQQPVVADGEPLRAPVSFLTAIASLAGYRPTAATAQIDVEVPSVSRPRVRQDSGHAAFSLPPAIVSDSSPPGVADHAQAVDAGLANLAW